MRVCTDRGRRAVARLEMLGRVDATAWCDDVTTYDLVALARLRRRLGNIQHSRPLNHRRRLERRRGALRHWPKRRVVRTKRGVAVARVAPWRRVACGRVLRRVAAGRNSARRSRNEALPGVPRLMHGTASRRPAIAALLRQPRLVARRRTPAVAALLRDLDGRARCLLPAASRPRGGIARGHRLPEKRLRRRSRPLLLLLVHHGLLLLLLQLLLSLLHEHRLLLLLRHRLLLLVPPIRIRPPITLRRTPTPAPTAPAPASSRSSASASAAVHATARTAAAGPPLAHGARAAASGRLGHRSVARQR